MSHVVSFNPVVSGSPAGSQKPSSIPFTDRSIKALKPRDKRFVAWASGFPGLGVRVTPSGAKSFVFKFDIDGRDRWLTFGRYPRMRVSEATRAYADALSLVERGEDPAAEKRDEALRRKSQPNVADLADLFIERHAKPNKRTWREDKRQLEKDVLPTFGDRPIEEVRRGEIIAFLNAIVERGAPVQANRTLALVRRLFNFAVDEGLIEASPCYRVKPRVAERPKRRFLALDEIRRLWRGLGAAAIEPTTASALKILLVTMQRSSEVVGMRYDELDLNAGLWVIPGERTKNARTHAVPLTPLAIELLRGTGASGPFVFQGRGQAEHLNRRSLQRALAKVVEREALDPVTPHDFRRTGSTLLGAFQVPRFDRSRVLNHSDRSIAAVYDVYDYETEKRAALTLWGDIITAAVDATTPVDERRLKSELKYADYLDR